MTHFSVCVALSERFDWITDDPTHLPTPEQTAQIGEAITRQLAPFDERGEWFKDGSRWDWWTIGGRFRDSWYCGPIATRGMFDLAKQQEHDRERHRKWWDEAHAEDVSEAVRKISFDILPGETMEQYIERGVAKSALPAAVFVRDRHWYENGRSGWFGSKAATECEIRTGDTPDICRFRHADSEATITSYSMTEDEWRDRWFDRFIKDLPPETVLVLVDCHV